MRFDWIYNMRFDWIYVGDNKFLDLFLTKKLLGYLIELNKITHSWFFFFSSTKFGLHT